jgi:hypothetical protein
VVSRSGTPRAEQGSRDDADAVSATVCCRTGGNDHALEQIVADLLLEPVEVAYRITLGVGAELDRGRDDTSVVALDDEVNLVTSPARAEV